MSRRSRKLNRVRKQKTEEVKKMENMKQVKGSAAEWNEIRKLPVGVLEIDHGYQRHLDMGWVKAIVGGFKPELVEVIQVSYRDGHYWVFDGQHTLTAIKEKFNDINYPVVCKVYHGLSREEESRLFYEFNTAKKKMSSAAMLKSQAIFGDEEVKGFLQHTKDAGFIIDPSKRVNCRYGIQAVKKAQTLFTRLGPDMYDRMLSLIKRTWCGEQWSVTQNMLSGVGTLLQTFGEKINDDKFIDQLKNVSENQIIKGAGRYTEESVPVAYACSLVDFYNKGLRSGKLKRVLLLED